MRWTSRRRSISYTQVKMEDVPRLLRIPTSECPDIFGYVFHDTNGPNHGLTLKIQWYLSNDICTDTHLQASCGKDSSKNSYWDLDGKKYTTGNVFLFIENKDFSYRCVWMTLKMTGEKAEYGSHVEELDEKC